MKKIVTSGFLKEKTYELWQYSTHHTLLINRLAAAYPIVHVGSLPYLTKVLGEYQRGIR